MAEQTKTKRPKAQPTPRQLEIKRLTDKGRDKRTDQETARLSQLKKEEKRARFLKMASARTQKVLDALVRLALCGNRNSYEYSADEAEKIVSACGRAAEEMAKAFAERKTERELFQL